MTQGIIKVGEELVIVGSGGTVVRLVARGPSEEASRGEVVGHAWEIVAAVGLGQEVGHGHIVYGAGKRVEAEEVEHGDVGRDLRRSGVSCGRDGAVEKMTSMSWFVYSR
jgi:hypothetical protein